VTKFRAPGIRGSLRTRPFWIAPR